MQTVLISAVTLCLMASVREPVPDLCAVAVDIPPDETTLVIDAQPSGFHTASLREHPDQIVDATVGVPRTCVSRGRPRVVTVARPIVISTFAAARVARAAKDW